MDKNYYEILTKNGLRVTPQRIAVLDALMTLKQHPSVDAIIEFIRSHHPNIAVGTIYKTLDTFVEKGITKRLKTDKDVMRYDAVFTPHHHLYCAKSDRVEDYYDAGLNSLLDNYFRTHKIAGFSIDEIKLQITGRFDK